MTSASKAKIQELKERISDQKDKIESLETIYTEKIDRLDSKKQSLELKSSVASSFNFIPGAGKKADQRADELKSVSEELLKTKKKKREEIGKAKAELEKLKNEYKNAKDEARTEKANNPEIKNATAKLKKFQTKNHLTAGITIGAIGVFLAITGLANIGQGNAWGVSLFAIIIGAISAVFSVPAFLKERKEKQHFMKAIVALSLTGATILGSIIAIIADPISVNARCASYNSVEEMKIGDSSLCKGRVQELEQQKKNEENAKNEAKQKAKDECSAKNYDWNSDKNRCNTEEEQKAKDEEEKARSECSAKNYDWNSSEKRCNTESEQQAKDAEREAAKKRQEEANKTTTIKGADHDENDMAGKFDKIMNACWDKLEAFWTGGVSILDSNDGYPITYSATVKGDGTIVEGYMLGHYRTRNGNIKELNCSYKNGSVTISGIK